MNHPVTNVAFYGPFNTEDEADKIVQELARLDSQEGNRNRWSPIVSLVESGSVEGGGFIYLVVEANLSGAEAYRSEYNWLRALFTNSYASIVAD